MENSDRTWDTLQPTAECNFPDSQSGYQIKQELGHNRAGGRVTYLAADTKTQQLVVIKRFQFARNGSSWDSLEAYEQEMKVLQLLNYPNIPQYLHTFETRDGFCLVQEYKQASSLAQLRSFTPEEIKQIAVGILEILVYLQQQIPPVIHRDIKPENILVDEQLMVYLVDFGLARMGGEEVAASSVVKGTLGFMPPEQLFNRQLTQASDLYSLGATLICLLTQTKSTQIGNLVDEAYRINFEPLVTLDSRFTNWLHRLTAPNLKYRFPDAATALNALQSINSVSVTSPNGFTKAIAGFLLLNLGFSLLVASFSVSHKIAEPIGFTNLYNVSDAIVQLKRTRQCLGCDLRGADLRGVDLRSADLRAADLTEADLTGADLRGAFLAKANLTNAQLLHTNLASTDLRNATMPDGSIHP